MDKKFRYIVAIIGFAASAALPKAALAISLEFTWSGYRECSSSSPAFVVSDVPAGTSRLAFKMVDKNVPTYPHGGGTIAYHGAQQIPAGAFLYRGPCPPAGQQHMYEWTVRALDANDMTTASATAAAKFPP